MFHHRRMTTLFPGVSMWQSGLVNLPIPVTMQGLSIASISSPSLHLPIFTPWENVPSPLWLNSLMRNGLHIVASSRFIRLRGSTPEGESVVFNVHSPAMIMADNAASLLAFALGGAGVASLPPWLVQEELRLGNLINYCQIIIFPSRNSCALPQHAPCT